jgi:hypothetical protein
MLMLLENRCSYKFDQCRDLYEALHNLCFNSGKNAAAAERNIAVIINIANNLQDYAEKSTEAAWAEKMNQASELEPAVRKRLEKQYESAVAGEYLKIRQYFIGAISTWLGQLYLLASGANLEHLPNPEFFENLNIPKTLDEKWALNALNEAEKLTFNLLFNVNEELALRSFGLNLAIRC